MERTSEKPDHHVPLYWLNGHVRQDSQLQRIHAINIIRANHVSTTHADTVMNAMHAESPIPQSHAWSGGIPKIIRINFFPPTRPNVFPLFPVFTPENPLIDSPSPLNIDAWSEALKDYPDQNLRKNIIGILTYGCRIGYTGPKTLILSKNQKSCDLNPTCITKQITEDIRLGRIVPIEPVYPCIVSPLGLVTKHDGGFRRIHNLSFPRKTSVNSFIPEEYATLRYTLFWEVLEHARLAGPNAVIIKRDLKDAFRNIPIALADQWLLGFQWSDKYYTERSLPFGLRSAPFIFNIFAEALHWILECSKAWHNTDHYLDDFMIITSLQEATPSRLAAIRSQWQSTLAKLGLPENPKKDDEGHVVTILGYEINTILLIARVPENKIIQSRSICSAISAMTSVKLRDIQSLAGLLSFFAPVVQLGHVFLRNIWNFIASYPPNSPPHLRRRLSRDAYEDLQWWEHFLPDFNGIIYYGSDRPEIFLYTDASARGTGAFFFRGFGGDWLLAAPHLEANQLQAISHMTNTSNASPDFNINPLEMQAVLNAFVMWAPQWQGYKIIVKTDNMTSYAGLIRQSLNGPTNKPLRSLMLIAARLDIQIQPEWIPGISNTLADALSRANQMTITNLCPQLSPDCISAILAPIGSIRPDVFPEP